MGPYSFTIVSPFVADEQEIAVSQIGSANFSRLFGNRHLREKMRGKERTSLADTNSKHCSRRSRRFQVEFVHSLLSAALIRYDDAKMVAVGWQVGWPVRLPIGGGLPSAQRMAS